MDQPLAALPRFPDHVVTKKPNLIASFSERKVTLVVLRSKTEEIATTQARLREAHLKYHLEMVEVLTPAQVTRYRELRGYRSKAAHHHQRKH